MKAMVREIIESEEGFRSSVYLCSEGYLTVGYGTKIHKDKMPANTDLSRYLLHVTPQVAGVWLSVELASNDHLLMSTAVAGIFDELREYCPHRAAIIRSMCYQMGVKGVVGFHGMWAAINLGDWDKAAEEMIDSLWARQTPARAKRHAEVIRTGDASEVYSLSASWSD